MEDSGTPKLSGSKSGQKAKAAVLTKEAAATLMQEAVAIQTMVALGSPGRAGSEMSRTAMEATPNSAVVAVHRQAARKTLASSPSSTVRKAMGAIPTQTGPEKLLQVQIRHWTKGPGPNRMMVVPENVCQASTEAQTLEAVANRPQAAAETPGRALGAHQARHQTSQPLAPKGRLVLARG
jgi:hypothetical protein